MTATTDTNTANGKPDRAPKEGKGPVVIYDTTWGLLKELRAQCGTTNDETIRAALMALKRNVGDVKAETMEQKLQRLASGKVDA